MAAWPFANCCILMQQLKIHTIGKGGVSQRENVRQSAHVLDGHDWVVLRPHNVGDACTETATYIIPAARTALAGDNGRGLHSRQPNSTDGRRMALTERVPDDGIIAAVYPPVLQAQEVIK